MNRNFIAVSLCSMAIGVGFAQDVKVNGNSGQVEVFKATNTSTSLTHKFAIRGVSTPSQGYGIGVRGEGGYRGVEGFATMQGSAGDRRGGNFFAGGATGGSNVGVWSESTGPATAVAVYGKVNAANGVGIYGECNTAQPGAKAAHFVGNVTYTGTLTPGSDARFKKNIAKIDGALDKVLKLQAKQYEFKIDAFPTLGFAPGVKYGLIAQELEQVLPSLVQDNIPLTNPSQSSAAPVNYKSVDYVSLIPFLIGAIQEQQAQIEALKKKIGG
jgi:hypothetical protein